MIAIVLNRKDFRENDQIVSLYTREKGKVQLLARGVKKIISKQAAHLEPFSVVEINIEPGKEIDHLTKVQSLQYFSKIRNDLEKSLLAGYAIDFVNRMIETEEKDVRIFDLIFLWLKYLEIDISNYPLDIFILKFLSVLGFTPELDHCVVCDKDSEPVVFCPAEGGFICANCLALKKDGGVVIQCKKKEKEILTLWLNDEWDKINKVESGIIHQIVFEFAEFHCGKKVRDWGNILNMLK